MASGDIVYESTAMEPQGFTQSASGFVPKWEGSFKDFSRNEEVVVKGDDNRPNFESVKTYKITITEV